MAFTIEFTERARRDLEEIVAHIQSDSPVNATRWRVKLQERLKSLHTFPEACGLAPENEYSGIEIRQLLHGQYRVLMTIRENTVFILTIRHGARRFIPTGEIEQEL